MHPEKAKSPILVTLSGKVTPDNIGQLLNKLLGINVNALGNLAVVRHGLLEKASSAIVVTVSASVIPRKFGSPEKALLPTEVTPFFIVK